MKKKVTITVDEGIWAKFSELKWDSRKSVSEMVEGLIKVELGKLKPVSERTIKKAEEMLSGENPIIVHAKNKVVDVPVKPVEKAAKDLRSIWKGKHPNDMCNGCKELNKNCKCGD